MATISVDKFDYCKRVSDALGRMFTLREWYCVEACYHANKTEAQALEQVKKIKKVKHRADKT